MRLLDWLRDGLLTGGASYRRSMRPRPAENGDALIRELNDPSGRHDFGRRAHRPDPKASYGFAPDPMHRKEGASDI